MPLNREPLRPMVLALSMIADHNRKMDKLPDFMSHDYFFVDGNHVLLHLVLDAVGLPKEDDPVQFEAGKPPRPFSRDYYTDGFPDVSDPEQGVSTENEIWAFLEEVRQDVERQTWKRKDGPR